MARQTKAQKSVDKLVNAAFQRNCSNVQFNIMDLGKVMNAGRDAIVGGQDLDEAMIAAKEQYRQREL